jgi:methylphosphotriester-DNA--protein-cysteine methyltransferase
MPDFSTPSLRHLALTTRNPLATSAFTYAVLTTRIYCRPDCPSRLARRANITFFDTALEAAAAGFRPCKRCAPDVEKGRSAQEEAVERVCQGMR